MTPFPAAANHQMGIGTVRERSAVHFSSIVHTRTPGACEKWASSVITTAPTSSAWAQIQTSLVGIGVPACFNACLTDAYT